MNMGLFKNLKFDLPSELVFSGIISGIAGSIVTVSLSNSTASFNAVFGKNRRLIGVMQ